MSLVTLLGLLLLLHCALQVNGITFERPDDALFVSFYYSKAANVVEAGYALAADAQECAKIAVQTKGVPINGWNAVYLEVLPSFADSADVAMVEKGYYCAGYAEGYTTGLSISQIYANYKLGSGWASNATIQWISNHTEWMEANVAAASPTNVYWRQVGNLLAQMRGMQDGYQAWAAAQVPAGPALPPNATFMINFVFESADVTAAMEAEYPEMSTELSRKEEKRLTKTYGSHCSALVRLTPSNELLVSHNTWSSLESMLRVYKTYVFGTTYSVAMSSYPATIHSGDDFYVLGNDFVVQETTNENMNPNVTARSVTPYSVSEFIRVSVANRLALTGQQWASTFCAENSGTYNNQYMIVDMSKFFLSPNSFTEDVLWVVEQMPGNCSFGDQSTVLKDTGYWASYNRPFFKPVYDALGFDSLFHQYGSLFSYTENYRAEIFRRNASDVVDVPTMMNLMRYNDYLHDPFSLVPNCSSVPGGACNPKYSPYLSIANRADLVPWNASFGDLFQFIGTYDQAAIDAKIISSTTMLNNSGTAWIISGPTAGGASNIPPFRFSKSPYNRTVHQGIPDLMNFSWTTSDVLFNGAAVPPPTATAFPIVGSIDAVYTSKNFSESNFVLSLVSLVSIAYTQRGLGAPFVPSVQSMIDVVSTNRVGVNKFGVVFDVQQPSVAPAEGTTSVPSVDNVVNILLWSTAAQLAAVGMVSFTVSTGTQAPSGDLPHDYTWIAGVSAAGVAMIALITIALYRRYFRASYQTVDEQQAMNEHEQLHNDA